MVRITDVGNEVIWSSGNELIGGGLAVSDITAIDAYVLPPHLKMIDHGVKAGDRASHLTSLPYQMAMAALASQSNLDVARAPATVPAEVQAFMGIIKVSADDALLGDYPAAWPGRIVVGTAAGRYERSVRDVPGDPARPFTEAEVAAKFECLMVPIAGKSRARQLFDLGSSLFRDDTSLPIVVTEVKALGGTGD